MDSTYSWTPTTLEAMSKITCTSFNVKPSNGPRNSFGTLMEPTNSWTPTMRESMFELADTGLNTESSKSISGHNHMSGGSVRLLGNPFTNPAIPLDDIKDSFTPDTLEEMLSFPNRPPLRSRLRFLDLPAEVRDMVYAELLTPTCGAPMDLAPCADCIHEHSALERRAPYDLEDPTTSSVWYTRLWSDMKRQFRSLVNVSRQVSHESSTVFWIQPFRFTGSVGWVLLNNFLKRIGTANTRRLKDITVCHPAFSVTPDYRPARQKTDFDSYHDLFYEHLRDFSLIEHVDCWPDNQSVPPPSEAKNWQEFGAFDAAVRLLVEADNLVRLSFTLPNFQALEDQASFEDLIRHPIHTIVWPQGHKLTITIINLIMSTAEDINHWELTFGQMYDTLDDHVWEMEHLAPWESFRSNDPVFIRNRAELARQYFDDIQALGWRAVQMRYDRRTQYPVKAGQRCVNKVLCQTLLDVEYPDICYPACPGAREEVLEHEGLRSTIQRMESELEYRENVAFWGDWWYSDEVRRGRPRVKARVGRMRRHLAQKGTVKVSDDEEEGDMRAVIEEMKRSWELKESDEGQAGWWSGEEGPGEPGW